MGGTAKNGADPDRTKKSAKYVPVRGFAVKYREKLQFLLEMRAIS